MMATVFSAPVMFSTSKMASVTHMNGTEVEYKDLVVKTRDHISFAGIGLAVSPQY